MATGKIRAAGVITERQRSHTLWDILDKNEFADPLSAPPDVYRLILRCGTNETGRAITISGVPRPVNHGRTQNQQRTLATEDFPEQAFRDVFGSAIERGRMHRRLFSYVCILNFFSIDGRGTEKDQPLNRMLFQNTAKIDV